jgi:hypothetical protein
MPTTPQSFDNHTRFVPLYHAFVLPVLAANVVAAIVRLYRVQSLGNGLGLLVAAALVLAALFGRIFALTVQDRVIRLEMRLRLRELLPADLQGRIAEFTTGQLVALRFAGDGELPGLAAKVLREGLKDKKAIKKMIQHWQADQLRA